MASQSKVAEMEKRLERLNEQLEKLEKALLDDDDDGKTNIEIPAGGRSNWEAGTTGTTELEGRAPETETEEIEIPAHGRNNSESTTVEREIPASSGIEEAAEFNQYLQEAQAEEERRRIERRKKARERQMTNGPYTPDENADDDIEVDIPAGGRTNWEKRQEGNGR